MANTFRPKEVLREAELAEKAGNVRVASKLFYTMAIYLSKKNRLPDALSVLERAIDLSKRSARLYVLKARITAKLEQSEECLQALKTFISYSLEKNKLHEYVGYLEEQLKDLPTVRKTFYEELLRLDRTTSFAFNGLARTYLELKDFERARTVLLDALRTKDQPGKVLELLRRVLRESKSTHALDFVDKYERGEMELEPFIEILGGGKGSLPHVSVPDLERNKGLKGLIADLERELGVSVDTDLDSVKPLVHEFRKRASDVIGDDAKARMDLALAFFEMGLLQDAMDELKYVPEMDPKYPEVLSLFGKIGVAQGADLQALNHYQKILRVRTVGDEMTKDALYQIIEIYSRMGDLDKALETAGRLEKMDPNYREIHKVKTGIKEMSRK